MKAGRVTLEEGRWKVVCEPHVAMRLKRIFPQLDRQYGEFTLPNNPEVCVELEWVSQRFALEFEPDDILRAGAERHRREEAAANALLSGHTPPPHFEMALPPRDYQAVAAALCHVKGGLLLADDVGLGKTISALAMLCDPRCLPALVVTLTSLPGQWAKEVQRFLPQLRIHIAKKGKPPKFLDPWPDILILNYHKLQGWADFMGPHIKAVVYDEVQELRRSGSGKHSAAFFISSQASYRIGLTATPFYNLGGEMFPVMECLTPGALGSRSEFLTTWCGATDSRGRAALRDPDAFGAYLRENALMLRRTRRDVNRELDPLTTIFQEVDCDTKALDNVSDRVAELARILLGGPSQRGAAMQAADELSWRLRMATGIGKAPFVAEFVKLLLESGEKILLYGWHRPVYDIWMDRFKDFNPALFTGSESPAKKAKQLERFIKGDTNLIIMSLRAGAGLNGLQDVCRTVVYGELDWSPGVHEQCTGRVLRDGQPDPVVAYYLVSNSGSDPIVSDSLGRKRRQIEGVRDLEDDRMQEAQVDVDRVKRLAADFLQRRGLPVVSSICDVCDLDTSDIDLHLEQDASGDFVRALVLHGFNAQPPWSVRHRGRTLCLPCWKLETISVGV